jgi:hypothetical protein
MATDFFIPRLLSRLTAPPPQPAGHPWPRPRSFAPKVPQTRPLHRLNCLVSENITSRPRRTGTVHRLGTRDGTSGVPAPRSARRHGPSITTAIATLPSPRPGSIVHSPTSPASRRNTFPKPNVVDPLITTNLPTLPSYIIFIDVASVTRCSVLTQWAALAAGQPPLGSAAFDVPWSPTSSRRLGRHSSAPNHPPRVAARRLHTLWRQWAAVCSMLIGSGLHSAAQ